MENKEEKNNELKLYKVNYVIKQLDSARETALFISQVKDEKTIAKYNKELALNLKKIHIFLVDNFKKKRN